MARLRRFAHNVVSSYLALGVGIIYSLVSVPLALSFLPKQEFGLWALLMQLINYLILIDLGMSGAATRLLIDHKDDPEGSSYAGMFKTSCLVALVQGLLVFAVGVVLAPFCPDRLQTPPDLTTTFVHLLQWQAAVTAFSFLSRPLTQLLCAHQRMDITNYGGMMQLTFGLGFVWFFLHQGHGLFSFLYANALCSVLSAIFLFSMCCRLDLFPTQFVSAKGSWKSFWEVFLFGKDLLLVTLGWQLVNASQIILVTRCLGLEAAAVWTVGTRVFNLVCQFIWRFSDSAGAAMGEMMTRGEKSKLFQRYGEIVTLSLSAAGVAAVLFACSNSLFISIWTSGKIHWSPVYDVLLAVWIIPLVAIRAHSNFILLTKEVHGMRYICFIEGVAFIAGALLLLRHGGIPAMIAVSVVCCILFSGTYGSIRVARYFECSSGIVSWRWGIPMVRCVAIMIPIGIVLEAVLSFSRLENMPIAKLAITVAVLSLAGAASFMRFGMPDTLRTEVAARFGPRMQPFFRLVSPRT